MSINLYNLELTLIKLAGNTTDPSTLLNYAEAIKNARTGAVITVDTFANLPSAATATEGSLYFVEADRIFYIPSNEYGVWKRLTSDAISNVWTWGFNGNGQLGDGTTVNKSSPGCVVGGFTDWCKISSGSNHVGAIRTNGTLWTWGYNLSGQLGDNTTISKSSPVSVVGGFTDWCQISAGGCHTAAMRTGGTLWTWGCNNCGQLGDNTVVNKSSPVSVVGGFTDWCQVSAGGMHIAAIRTNGTLWIWGSNNYGRLGDNTIVAKSSPVSVVGGFTDWCQVSAGDFHTAAIRTNRTLWTWGSNGYGQLGDNTIVAKSSPVSVVGGFINWCQVSAGQIHTAAIQTNGTLWTWGLNNNSQLGDRTQINKSSPVSVVGGFTDWCQVSAGSSHTSAIRTGGSLWSWGSNFCGRLGDNTTVDKSSPISIFGSGTATWCAVSAGGNHTAAINANIY